MTISETGAWIGETHHHNDTGLAAALINLVRLSFPDWKGLHLIDVGTGDGFIPQRLRAAGLNALGIDGNHAYDVEHRNLTAQWTDIKTAPLVTFIEVWEHVPAEFEGVMVRNVVECVLDRPDAVLIVSAAIPGQGGEGHVNCVTQDHVARQIRLASGMLPDPWLTRVIREQATMWWTKRNLMAFTRPVAIHLH